MTLKFDGWPKEYNRSPLLCYFKRYASFHSHWLNSNLSYSPETHNLGQNQWFCLALWPWNSTDDHEKQYGTSSMLLQALCVILWPLVNSNWSYSPETPNLGQNRQFFLIMRPWHLILKNNKAPLLSNKLCASCHHHMCIQTGVTVRKWLSWVLTSVTLTFDLLLWPFAWTSLLSMVITPENYMMIR